MESELSVKDRLDSYGNFILVGLSGTELNDDDKRLLDVIKPIGILLLGRNFDKEASSYEEWNQKLATLISRAKEYSAREKMLVSLDHEGGRVHRAPAPITHFPAAAHYRDRLEDVATAMAEELKSLGVNVSWAPVADVHSNPENPIIGDRAFGTEPEDVADCAVRFAHALQEAGVLPCAKHFPGHGDTSTDSHLELPVLEVDVAEFRNRELVPFKAMIEAQVPLIMTAHVLFRKLDPDYPATFSRSLLTETLRHQLGFEGVVVSDDVEMSAVAKSFHSPHEIARSFLAGCDLYICSGYTDPSCQSAWTVTHSLSQCLMKKEISENDLQESYKRIKTVWEMLPDYSVSTLPSELLDKNQALANSIKEAAGI